MRILADDYKKNLLKNMTENLSMLRSAINLSQSELADILGFTRQTISAFESNQREMPWTVFLALILLFIRNDKSKRMLIAFEIYTSELNEHLKI